MTQEPTGKLGERVPGESWPWGCAGAIMLGGVGFWTAMLALGDELGPQLGFWFLGPGGAVAGFFLGIVFTLFAGEKIKLILLLMCCCVLYAAAIVSQL